MTFKTQMNKKTISIISYLTILGWAVSFIAYHNGGKSALAKYHLKQSFGLGLLGTAATAIPLIIDGYVAVSKVLFLIINLLLLLSLTLGIRNATQQQKKPIPLIGSIFIDRFYFII